MPAAEIACIPAYLLQKSRRARNLTRSPAFPAE